MNLYVTNADPYRPLRKATPGEALQFALTCRTCGGSGEFYLTNKLYSTPCESCVDGIPREWIETGAGELIAHWRAIKVSHLDFNEMVVDVLVALRDREETE